MHGLRVHQFIHKPSYAIASQEEREQHRKRNKKPFSVPKGSSTPKSLRATGRFSDLGRLPARRPHDFIASSTRHAHAQFPRNERQIRTMVWDVIGHEGLRERFDRSTGMCHESAACQFSPTCDCGQGLRPMMAPSTGSTAETRSETSARREYDGERPMC